MHCCSLCVSLSLGQHRFNHRTTRCCSWLFDDDDHLAVALAIDRLIERRLTRMIVTVIVIDR